MRSIAAASFTGPFDIHDARLRIDGIPKDNLRIVHAQGSPFDQKKEYLLNRIIGRDAGGRRINSHLLHDGSSIVRFEVGPPRAVGYAGTRPELAARSSAAPGGAGGISVIMSLINSTSSSIRKALLWRFSKPSVETGLALRPRPQTEPA